jgi:hypothetical protein
MAAPRATGGMRIGWRREHGHAIGCIATGPVANVWRHHVRVAYVDGAHVRVRLLRDHVGRVVCASRADVRALGVASTCWHVPNPRDSTRNARSSDHMQIQLESQCLAGRQ